VLSCLRPLNVWFSTLIASLNFQRVGADIRSQELGAGTYVKKPYVMKKIGVAIWDELDRKYLAAYAIIQTGFIVF
jgi:hypothetical protein